MAFSGLIIIQSATSLMFSISIGIQHCSSTRIAFISVFYRKYQFIIIIFASSFINFCLIIRKWHAGVGPTKDAYSIGDNPQYSLRVPAGRGSVWVLLTRHITNIDDFRDNKEYITLLVYQNSGKRIYYPCKYKMREIRIRRQSLRY